MQKDGGNLRQNYGLKKSVFCGIVSVLFVRSQKSILTDSPLEQIFCFTGKIQRNVGNRAVFAIPALGKAYGVFGVTVGDIPLKGRRGLVLAALCLDGDDLCAVLQHEVDFAGFVRVIARLHVKLTAKLLQHIVFSERPLELIVGFQQNGAVVNACHVLEQPGIKEKQLELVQLIKGGEGMLHLGNIVDAVEHTG